MIIVCISSDLGEGPCLFIKATHLYLVKNMCVPQKCNPSPNLFAQQVGWQWTDQKIMLCVSLMSVFGFLPITCPIPQPPLNSTDKVC